MNAAERLLGPTALARHGARVALICEDTALSYAELAARVARTGAALRSLGVEPEQRIALFMRDTPQFVATWLGAVRIGAVPIALNVKLSDAEAAHVVRDSGAWIAVVEDGITQAPAARTTVTASGLAARAERAMPAAAHAAGSESPAFMLYSSGTTGHAKGIVHAHRSIEAVGAAYRLLGLGAGDRVMTTSRFFFAYGLEHGLLAALACGATAVVHPDWPDTDAVVELVRRHRPAAVFSVPTMYRRLLALPRERLAPFRAVRRYVSAGERLSKGLVEHWRDAVGGELLNLYGMSETFCACMMTPPGCSDGVRTGVPFEGVRVELRGPEAEPSELWVQHPALARGYANRPAETSAQFRDGWFCSRDLFVRDAQGYYIHQGRSDELVKVAGQWVQPLELEQAAASEADVSEAACVPVADADGLERLALFVTARADPLAAQRAAKSACERLLPRHKRPKWVRAIAELPRTATGKIQRFKLREMLERELAARD